MLFPDYSLKTYIITMNSSNAPTPETSLFNTLSEIFNRQQISVVLVGGYALIAHKIQRMTYDIDFILTPDDERKIEHELLKIGYSVTRRQEAFIQFKSAKTGLMDLDFLISDEQTISKLIKNGRTFTVGENRFTVPSPVHLIAMKLHSISGNKRRENKDFPDIIQLMSLPEVHTEMEQIKNLFDKYSLHSLYTRALEAIGKSA